MPETGAFFYICSNGRCGTQFLARRLSELADTELVRHEPYGLQMASRRVFRDPDERYRQIGKEPELQRFLLHISHVIASGRTFVSCGWHAYAYLDYFQERFGPNFRYVHLVRNPYENAMSHATNHLMTADHPNPNVEMTKVFGGDPNVTFKALGAHYDAFSSIERQLFHWLEVTQFVTELDYLDGNRGLVRFEDVMDPNTTALDDLASVALGRTISVTDRAPFDRVQSTYRGADFSDVNAELAAEVDKLAIKLGYSQAELDAARDPAWLMERYAQRRYELDLSPHSPVVK